VAEGARLESVYTLTGIVGSNPTLSAILTPHTPATLHLTLKSGSARISPWRFLYDSRAIRSAGAGYQGMPGWP
jgi:hypothetical protein